jgi:hypothetical protein
MVYKRNEKNEVFRSVSVVDIGVFLNIGNDMLKSYSYYMNEVGKLDRMYDTSHERIFRKLKLITDAYSSEFDRFESFSKSGRVPDSIARQLERIIRRFYNDPELNLALAKAKTLSLLDESPQNMGYSQIEKIFNEISASYKLFSESITDLYNRSIERQVRIYRRRK